MSMVISKITQQGTLKLVDENELINNIDITDNTKVAQTEETKGMQRHEEITA